MTLNTLFAILPEIIVLVMACVILLTGLFTTTRLSQLTYFLAQFTLVATAVVTWHHYSEAASSIVLFHQQFILDRFSVILKLVIYLSVFVTFLYVRTYNSHRSVPSSEFYVLGLLSMLGMMVLVSGYSLLTLFLGLELLSLPIYAMVALQRGKERCIEAATKYFVIGALATGMLLYGMSLLFGLTRSLSIVAIGQYLTVIPAQETMVAVFGLVFLLVGICFKLGAVPFHMWVPDVYDGAPTSVTLFLSTAPKLAAFGLAIRLLVQALPIYHIEWTHILIVAAVLSMAVGNIAAIVQANIKRMLAYSSIAHIGYMLLGLVCGTSRGYAASLFYMVTYSLMSLGAFGTIVLMAKQGFEANMISDFSGLGQRNPWLAFVVLMLMFSLAGIPPLVGFIAKVGVIEALLQVHLVWLAVLAVLFAIVGAYYYIRVVKVMYFEKTGNMPPITYPLDTKVVITLNGLAVLLLGLFPGALFTLCHTAFAALR